MALGDALIQDAQPRAAGSGRQAGAAQRRSHEARTYGEGRHMVVVRVGDWRWEVKVKALSERRGPTEFSRAKGGRFADQAADEV